MKDREVELVTQMVIPRKLIPIVSKILEYRRFPEDDDGMTDVIVMNETGCTVDEKIKAESIITDFIQEIREWAKEMDCS